MIRKLWSRLRGRDFWRWVAVTIVVTLLVPTSAALGHGDVHARIEKLSKEIGHQPHNAALYARRGSLYMLDESWEHALADFESARRVGRDSPYIDFLRARVLVELDENERAVALVDSFLSSEPQHADGYLVRARAMVALGRIDSGAKDYTRAIALFERPEPRHYLERARALIDAGRVDEALVGLREAVADLGALASVVELAVAVEEKRGRYEEALGWADQVSRTLRHSPRWRAIVGNLAERSGQASRAKHEYREALVAIDALPQARQGTGAMTALRAELAGRLKERGESPSKQLAPRPAIGALGQGLALAAILIAVGLFATAATRSGWPPSPLPTVSSVRPVAGPRPGTCRSGHTTLPDRPPG